MGRFQVYLCIWNPVKSHAGLQLHFRGTFCAFLVYYVRKGAQTGEPGSVKDCSADVRRQLAPRTEIQEV